MKNIKTILTEVGITLTDEQQTAIDKAVSENYKTVNEFTTKVEKLESERDSWKDQYNGARASLDKFDGADIDALKKQFTDAQKRAEDAENTFKQQMAARDYSDAVKATVADVKFSSGAAQRDFINQLQAKNLPLEGGKLLGYTDFLEEYKKDNPDALKGEEDGKKATFTEPTNPGNPPIDPKDAEMERKMRAVMGIRNKK